MDSDEALYRRLHGGDMLAFDTLYERYERRLFGFILRMLRNRQDAEDVFHEALLNVLRSREVRFDQGNFCAWIYRIARNLCLNHLRSGQRSQRARAQLVTPPPMPSAEERLPETLAEVYHLRSSGLSYEEMATVLKVPLGTVKSRMHQMTNQLQQEVDTWTAH
jgi:RNA polymerase sigma-70 factor (ECF subfamily)